MVFDWSRPPFLIPLFRYSVFRVPRFTSTQQEHYTTPTRCIAQNYSTQPEGKVSTLYIMRYTSIKGGTMYNRFISRCGMLDLAFQATKVLVVCKFDHARYC